jgi:hypothetical protein
MNAFITQQAASVGVQQHPRVTVETTPVASRPNGGARQALGVALVAIGTRLAGEMPSAKAGQPEGNRA